VDGKKGVKKNKIKKHDNNVGWLRIRVSRVAVVAAWANEREEKLFFGMSKEKK
jgi:hypothetical protein